MTSRPGNLSKLLTLTARAVRAAALLAALSVPLPGLLVPSAGAATIIDHTTADIWQIPDAAIEAAKAELHIAYGHTSHGSQLISGMGTNGGQQLDEFMTNNGGTPGMYLWNVGGTGGALDLRDTPFQGAYDLGNPDRYAWEQATRAYLTEHPECNVIIWSWCGQAATTLENIDIYLNLMEGLIADYPGVAFVFMTGHLDGTGETGQLHLANAYIRDHCLTHDRILYDFADIESYDPDHLQNYMPLLCTDNCDYDSDGDGYRESNWALDWQSTHIEGVDWWPSGAAHSQHLNGNLKGYAAWWLWAVLAGWSGPASTVPDPAGILTERDLRLLPGYPNPSNGLTTLAFELTGSRPIELGIFSIDGRYVTTLWDGPAGPGRHEVHWSGRDAHGHALAPGTYFLRLRSGDRIETGKLLLTE